MSLVFSIASAQRIKGVDDLKFLDSLSSYNTWMGYKEYYSKDTLKYELNFRVDCNSCFHEDFEGLLVVADLTVKESAWRRSGSLEWESEIVTYSRRKGVYLLIKYRFYSKRGKLAIRTRVKRLIS